MENADKNPEEAPKPALSEKKEAKDGVSTQEAEEKPSVVNEEVSEVFWESLPQEITPQRVTDLQRDLTAFVSNIQTAADARESLRRKEVEEAHKIRLERLENHEKSSQEKFEEITRGWLIVKEKATLQDLWDAQSSQQQLCALLLEDKKKFINDLQQELKAGDERFVKDLRKEAEEMDLMIERMDDHMKTLKKAYREEMSQITRVYQQQSEVILTRDVTEWDQFLKKLWDKEQEALEQRRKQVEEYEEKFNQVIMDAIDIQNTKQLKANTKLQVRQRDYQRLQGTNLLLNMMECRRSVANEQNQINLVYMTSRIGSMKAELQNLQIQYNNHVKQIREIRRNLSKQIKCSIQQYERTQKKIKPFAAADARKFEEMWLTVEAEVKQLVERALLTDSLICKRYLGIVWERPQMAFMELSGPIQPQKQVHQAVGESDVVVGDGKPSMDTLKKVMELLCDEAGFLIEDRLQKLLAPLEKDEQIIVKMGSLLCSLGIEEEDVPKLTNFFIKPKEQHQEQTELGETSDQAEAMENTSTSNLTSDLIHPNHVLPALKSFLEQQIREKSSSSLQAEARDSSEDEAYWESMGNIISEHKVRLWEVTENTLNQYLEVLTEISELVPEAEGLWQQNTELRMLLQQSLISRVIDQMP